MGGLKSLLNSRCPQNSKVSVTQQGVCNIARCWEYNMVTTKQESKKKIILLFLSCRNDSLNQLAISLLTTCNNLVVTSCRKPCKRVLISASCNKLLEDVNRLVQLAHFWLCRPYIFSIESLIVFYVRLSFCLHTLINYNI